MRDSFGIHGTPAAVLVGGDGRLMGPIASGELLVRRLLSAGLSGTDFEPHNHVDVSGAPAESITGESVLRARETVSSMPREQDVILVDEATGASVSLDGIGSVVWSVLDGTSPLGRSSTTSRTSSARPVRSSSTTRSSWPGPWVGPGCSRASRRSRRRRRSSPLSPSRPRGGLPSREARCALAPR